MILVFGTICLDRVRRVSQMPPMGGYVEIESEQFMLGGEAANTALALKHWDAEFVLAGNGLGEGAMGDLLRSALDDHGLAPVEDHIIKPGVTPVCDVYVDDAGERTMIGQGFSAMKETVDSSRLPFKPGEWFTAEPNMGEAAREAVRLAHGAGMKVYTMDFVRADDPICEGSFSQTSTDWAGVRGDQRANLSWLRGWVESHRCFGILTDGSNGTFAGAPEKTVSGFPPTYSSGVISDRSEEPPSDPMDLRVTMVPPFPIERVIDATGAGDLFRAGMLFGLESGWPIPRILRFASAAGALACSSLGATSRIPTRDEVEALAESRLNRD